LNVTVRPVRSVSEPGIATAVSLPSPDFGTVVGSADGVAVLVDDALGDADEGVDGAELAGALVFCAGVGEAASPA
jgi:hypothetical protein